MAQELQFVKHGAILLSGGVVGGSETPVGGAWGGTVGGGRPPVHLRPPQAGLQTTSSPEEEEIKCYDCIKGLIKNSR